MSGWFKKLLEVDLGKQKIEVKGVPEELLSKYLGGRGVGSKLLYDWISPYTDALSPENIIIISTGPLTATSAPTSGRFNLSTKSPLTGTIFPSNSGGMWGARFKRCGYDFLVIKGKAKDKVNLVIDGEKVYLEDATFLWGKNNFEVAELLKARYPTRASFLTIGVAGENQVLIASIMNDARRALARGGVGAVMGSKNLKAIIVVEGNEKIGIANPEQMKFVTYESNKVLKQHPITSKALPEFGTSVLVNICNEAGIFPTRNFQEGQFSEADEVSGEAIREKIFVKKAGCYGCWIQCGRHSRTRYREGEGPEYETNWALGANCGIGDIDIITEAHFLCNDFGLDGISTGTTIACAMELTEKGIKDAGIRFGEKEKLLDYIRKIAYKDGVGAELAEGSLRFARRYKAEKYAMQVKGLEIPGYDPRGSKGMGLCFATSPRGGCHLVGGYIFGAEILGVPKMINRFTTYGKAGLLAQLQNLGAVLDSVVACRFASFALNEHFWARLLTAVTGIDFSPDAIMKIGERIINLERLFNLREGFTSRDDRLPERLTEEALKEGPTKGQVVNISEMVSEYYQFRNWDKDGIPKKEKLKELGLDI